MRLLVTGANGLIGRRLCTLLEARGHQVVGLSRGPQRRSGNFDYRACELTDREQVEAEVSTAQPEAVVHTASIADLDACERNPEEAFDANVTATAHLARAANRVGAHFIFVSTDYVFDGEDGPYPEEAIPNPRGVYALTKHLGEQTTRTLCHSWSVARTALVYGWPAEARKNFGSWLVGTLAAGERVRLFEDQLVSPTFAGSAAAMLAELAERQLPGHWHLADAEVLDRVSFGKALCGVFGFDPQLIVPVKRAEVALAAPRPGRSGLRTFKAQSALQAAPLTLDEGLRRFLAEYREAEAV